MTLRVAIVTQDEPFYLPEFFEEFLQIIPDGVDIASITTMNVLGDSLPELISKMYNLYGPTNFFIRGFAFVYRKIAVAFGRSYSVKNIANRYDVPVEHRDSVNRPAFIDYVESNKIDLLLSVSAPEIFETELLAAPLWGCLNVHTASLPEYRGMLPTFWALYNGDDEIGITVHTMEEQIDCGKIVRQTTFPVSKDDTLDTVIRKGKRNAAQLVAEALRDIASGDVSLEPMDCDGTYYSFPTADDRREFKRRGREIL